MFWFSHYSLVRVPSLNITYADCSALEADALKAIKDFQGKPYKGKRLWVENAKAKESRPKLRARQYISSIVLVKLTCKLFL